MKAISLTGTERRQAERFVLELPALLSMRDGNRKPVSCEVMTRDISSEGAFFLNCKSIPVGSDVKVNLMLFLEDRYKLNKEKILIYLTKYTIFVIFYTASEGANYRFCSFICVYTQMKEISSKVACLWHRRVGF